MTVTLLVTVDKVVVDRTTDSPAAVVYYASNHDWFGYQHFYQGLARAFARDRQVLYVGPSLTRGGANEGGLQEVDNRVWLLRTRTPRGGHRRALRPLRDLVVARAALRSLADLGLDPDATLVWAYTTDALAFMRKAPLARSVYWTGDEVVDPLEPKLLRAVEHVFTVSPSAADEKRLVVRDRVTPMPMAIDPSPFERAAISKRVPGELASLPRPLFGYGGAVNQRIDWELIRALAHATEGSIVMVGPPTDTTGRNQATEFSSVSNVHFLGHRDEQSAPDYVAAFDVGLLPYRLTAFNLGSNPVKIYQYLAAGIPVVSTRLPALAPLAASVRLADDHPSFVNLALAEAVRPRVARDRFARQVVARDHSYDHLVARIDEVLARSAGAA